MLKLLACLFMLLDHIGYYFRYPACLNQCMIFCAASAGSLSRSSPGRSPAVSPGRSNLVRYFVRMAGFALISERDHPPGRSPGRTAACPVDQCPGHLHPGDRPAWPVTSWPPMPDARHDRQPAPDSRRRRTPCRCRPRFDVRINLGGIELDRRPRTCRSAWPMMLGACRRPSGCMPDYGTLWHPAPSCSFSSSTTASRKKTGKSVPSTDSPASNLVFLVIRIINRR